jgi:hypothetical protein
MAAGCSNSPIFGFWNLASAFSRALPDGLLRALAYSSMSQGISTNRGITRQNLIYQMERDSLWFSNAALAILNKVRLSFPRWRASVTYFGLGFLLGLWFGFLVASSFSDSERLAKSRGSRFELSDLFGLSFFQCLKQHTAHWETISSWLLASELSWFCWGLRSKVKVRQVFFVMLVAYYIKLWHAASPYQGPILLQWLKGSAWN